MYHIGYGVSGCGRGSSDDGYCSNDQFERDKKLCGDIEAGERIAASAIAEEVKVISFVLEVARAALSCVGGVNSTLVDLALEQLLSSNVLLM